MAFGKGPLDDPRSRRCGSRNLQGGRGAPGSRSARPTADRLPQGLQGRAARRRVSRRHGPRACSSRPAPEPRHPQGGADRDLCPRSPPFLDELAALTDRTPGGRCCATTASSSSPWANKNVSGAVTRHALVARGPLVQHAPMDAKSPLAASRPPQVLSDLRRPPIEARLEERQAQRRSGACSRCASSAYVVAYVDRTNVLAREASRLVKDLAVAQRRGVRHGERDLLLGVFLARDSRGRSSSSAGSARKLESAAS